MWKYNTPGERKAAKAALLPFQLNRCAVCVGRMGASMHVDHDHDTGLIRGLLCHGCNTTEGRGRRLTEWDQYLAMPPAQRYHAGETSLLPVFVVQMDKWIANERAAIETAWERFPALAAEYALAYIQMGASDPRCPTWIHDRWWAAADRREAEARAAYERHKDIYTDGISVSVAISDEDMLVLGREVSAQDLTRMVVGNLQGGLYDRLMRASRKSLIGEVADAVAQIPRHAFRGGDDWGGDLCALPGCEFHWRQHPFVHETEQRLSDLLHRREDLVDDAVAVAAA
jgi:hypothetical protein